MDYVCCSRCGQRVSNTTGVEMTVRAWVECIECIPTNDAQIKKEVIEFIGKAFTKTITIDQMMATNTWQAQMDDWGVV